MITTAAELPPAYPSHPYATEEVRRIAQDGMILRVQVGSGVHGTSVAGTDDDDHMGICVEPPQYVTGLQRFEQFECHTAWDRFPEGWQPTRTEPVPPTRSGPGDLDVTVYGLRKFCRLALAGNPSIMTLFFVPEDSIVYATDLGRDLLAKAPLFVSMAAADRYLGYLGSQLNGITGQGRVNRPELIEQYGYDTKFAGHAVRLGVQGIELITTGHIQLPMGSYWRTYVQSVRRGEVTLDEVLDTVRMLESSLRRAQQRNPLGLPEQPNRHAVDRWLHRAYTSTWGGMVLRSEQPIGGGDSIPPQHREEYRRLTE